LEDTDATGTELVMEMGAGGVTGAAHQADLLATQDLGFASGNSPIDEVAVKSDKTGGRGDGDGVAVARGIGIGNGCAVMGSIDGGVEGGGNVDTVEVARNVGTGVWRAISGAWRSLGDAALGGPATGESTADARRKTAEGTRNKSALGGGDDVAAGVDNKQHQGHDDGDGDYAGHNGGEGGAHGSGGGPGDDGTGLSGD